MSQLNHSLLRVVLFQITDVSHTTKLLLLDHL